MNKQVKLTYYGEKCTMEITAQPGNESRRARVYVTIPWDPEDVQVNGITERPPYSVKGTNPANDNLWKRYNQAEVRLMREAVDKAMELDLIPRDSYSFSRKAGCSCGCSPGMIYKHLSNGMEYWVTITSPKKQAELEKLQKETASNFEARTMASVVV
jgi:hypothetical protein